MFTYLVHVNQLEFYGFHGVSDEEQKLGHRYLVDFTGTVSGNCLASDDVADTVDYGAVAQHILEVGASTQCRTVEHLGHLIISRLLGAFASLEEIELTIMKPYPPANFIAAEVGVTLHAVRE